MTTQAILTPDNAPRDFASLMGLTRAIRYRLALNMNLVLAGSDAAKGFVGATPENQSKALMEALAARDGGGGQPQTQQAQQAQAPAPMQPTGHVTPQQMGGLPPAMGQGGMQSPPPAMGSLQSPAPTKRSPATPSDPTNSGSQAGTPAAVDPAALVKLNKKIDDLTKMVGEIKSELDEVPSIGNLEELSETIQGLARITKMNTILLLELAESALSMDKVTIASMVMSISDSGEFDNILKASAEGKG
jgi:hypothetical protein